jgi:glycosyltransferase involved in cell wall biosynthesis
MDIPMNKTFKHVFFKFNFLFDDFITFIKSFLKRRQLPVRIMDRFDESSKRVLICYLNDYQNKSESEMCTHQNIWESMRIVQTFKSFGYLVDIIRYDDLGFKPKYEYEVLFGVGSNFERLSYLMPNTPTKIYYATGTHWSFWNNAEQYRVKNLYYRKNFKVRLRRQCNNDLSVENSNIVLCKGNDYVCSTYNPFSENIHKIDVSTPVKIADYRTQIPAKVKKTFLWMGSAGLVHKGLDLVLEAFASLPEHYLIICGPVSRELDFKYLYHNELYLSKNVTVKGYINMCSDVFDEIAESAGFMIYPSCSEGMAGSVVSSMAKGLIPIVSEVTGVETKNFGFKVDADVKKIIEVIIEASNLNDSEFLKRSNETIREVKNRYTRNHFGKNIDNFLNVVLEQNH